MKRPDAGTECVAVVRWRDARTSMAERPRLEDMVTAGFLVQRDESIVGIAQTLNERKAVDMIAIPSSQVVELTIVSVPHT